MSTELCVPVHAHSSESMAPHSFLHSTLCVSFALVNLQCAKWHIPLKTCVQYQDLGTPVEVFMLHSCCRHMLVLSVPAIVILKYVKVVECTLG